MFYRQSFTADNCKLVLNIIAQFSAPALVVVMQKFTGFFHPANILEHGAEFFQFDLFGIKPFIAYFLLQLLIAVQPVSGKYSS